MCALQRRDARRRHCADAATHAFDSALIATHADTALALLAAPDPTLVHAEVVYAHPVFASAAAHAQERLWTYDLADCEAGFLTGQSDVGLHVLTKDA